MRWYKCRWYKARRWTRWSILTLKPARGKCKPAEQTISTWRWFGGWFCCHLGCLSVRLQWKSTSVKVDSSDFRITIPVVTLNRVTRYPSEAHLACFGRFFWLGWSKLGNQGSQKHKTTGKRKIVNCNFGKKVWQWRMVFKVKIVTHGRVGWTSGSKCGPGPFFSLVNWICDFHGQNDKVFFHYAKVSYELLVFWRS